MFKLNCLYSNVSILCLNSNFVKTTTTQKAIHIFFFIFTKFKKKLFNSYIQHFHTPVYFVLLLCICVCVCVLVYICIHLTQILIILISLQAQAPYFYQLKVNLFVCECVGVECKGVCTFSFLVFKHTCVEIKVLQGFKNLLWTRLVRLLHHILQLQLEGISFFSNCCHFFFSFFAK